MDRQSGTGMLTLRRRLGWLGTVTVALLVVAVGGCSGNDKPGQPRTPRDPATTGAQKTADALADCKAFSDGVWTGSANVKGTVSTGTDTSMSATGGSIDFQITVSGGKVVDGTVTQNTDVAGKVAGRPATGHIVAHGIPGGTGDAVTVTWQAGTITVTIDGLPSQQIPVSTAGTGSFAPTSGDCTTLTGDLFTYSRGVENADPGMKSTITGIFTARRR
jgi:hypothetical protein